MPAKENLAKESREDPQNGPSPIPTVSVEEEDIQSSQDSSVADPNKCQDDSDCTKVLNKGQPSNEKTKKKSKKTCGLRNEQEGGLLEWV